MGGWSLPGILGLKRTHKALHFEEVQLQATSLEYVTRQHSMQRSHTFKNKGSKELIMMLPMHKENCPMPIQNVTRA